MPMYLLRVLGNTIKEKIYKMLLFCLLTLFGFLAPKLVFAQSAAPVFHAADLQQNTGTSGAAVVNRPTNLAANDLVVVVLSDRDNPTFTAPTGFNLVRRETGGNDAACVAVYWKIATASEPTSYSFSRSTNRNWRATALRVSNINIDNPIGASNGANSSGSDVTSLTVNSITTTTPNALLLAGVAMHNTIGGFTGASGMSAAYANLTPRPGNGGQFQVVANAGASGNRTFTWSTARRAAAVLWVVNGGPNNTNAPGGVFGAALWLKANEGTSTTTNGAAVNSWNDHSGNAKTPLAAPINPFIGQQALHKPLILTQH